MENKLKNNVSYGTVVADESDYHRCCGIQYKNWILTSGLILSSYISAGDLKLNNLNWGFGCDMESDDGNDDLLELSDNDIKYLSKKISRKPFKIISVYDKEISVNSRKTSNHISSLRANGVSTLSTTVAYPIGVFKSNLVNQYVSDNFSDWQLCVREDQNQESSSDVVQCLLSVFLLLKIGSNGEISNDYITPLTYFLNICYNKQNVFRGYEIIVESTPFTIPQFYNSWSKGIISNTVGNEQCLFYTDARLVVGCVGAPVYHNSQSNKGQLLGMILNPMLWNQGEWAGFSVAVNLQVVLSEVLRYKAPLYNNYKNFTHDLSTRKLIENLDQSIVLVRCGFNWGSGVIVNVKLGVIITCAHVVNYGEIETILIECGNYKTKATVVYSNKAGEVFDIAVLSTEPLLKLKEVPLAKNSPIKGETVFCAGYPMVDTDKVTLSKGIVANVEPDIAIQTTCCIQAGASGGAIIRPCGSLVGIPVSNMSCASTRALFPHCNLSVPVTGFANVLSQYFKTKDINCLKNLLSRSPLALQKWSFQDRCKL